MHEARRRDGRDMDAPPRDRLFNDDEIAWMRVNYPRFTFDESLRLFRLHFGRAITRAQWKNVSSRYGLGKSYRWEEARFRPGHTPANKGRKGYRAPGSEKGWFKKGDRPGNFLPLYSERWRTTGSAKARILFIKVPGRSPWPAQETRDEHGNDAQWVRKAVWVWEQANGPVPKGSAIVQVDGDPANCDLGNLECVSRRVLQRLNAPWAMREGRDDKDLYTAQLRVAQVGDAIAQRKQREAA